MHALQRKKTMFVHVNYDWHMSHDDGSTDFSDDETLEDHPRNGLRTPEKLSPADKLRPNLSVFPSPNNNNSPDKFANTSDWSRSTPSDQGNDSPGSYRIMPPPPGPPPPTKKASLCKFEYYGHNLNIYLYFVYFYCYSFVQFRVRISLHIWLVAWKRGLSSPCPCLPLLIILYRLMCTKCVRPLGSFRVVTRSRHSTTRGRHRLIAERGLTPLFPRIIRERCTIQYIFTVSHWFGWRILAL